MAKKILIMEDEEVLAKILKRKLTEAGFCISLVSGGDEVLAFLEKETPDLVILDMLVPGKNAFEIIEQMNGNPDTNLVKLPVIIISNSGNPVEIDKAVSLGVKDYIIKTNFDPQEAFDKICKQLNIL